MEELFWFKYKIYGIDINPKCKELEEENIKIFIGSQADREFLRKVKEQISPIDILIDDGGHTMRQQIISYEELFPAIQENGVYLCEDVHTSYWLSHGGGYKRRGTFIEYSKNFIDFLNAYHSEQRSLKISEFTRSVDSIHYYDSIIVIEKKRRSAPFDEKTGNTSFQNPVRKSKIQKFRDRLEKESLTMINRVLRFFRLGGFIWK